MTKEKVFHYKNNRLQQVKGLVNVVKFGSITEAAKEMNLTQAAVSQQIASLEEQLEVKLFKKIGSKLQLTEEGRKFYNMSVPHLQGIENLFEQFLESIDEEEQNHIRIAAHQFVMIHYVPKWIAKMKELNANNSKIKFTLFNITKEEAIEKLINKEVDIIFYDLDSNVYPEVNVECLIEEPFAIGFSYLRKNLLEKESHSITLQDILKEDLIITKSYYSEKLPNFLNNKNSIEIINGSYEMIRNMVLKNLCVSYAPISYINGINDNNTEIICSKDISHLVGYYRAHLGVKKNTNIKYLIQQLMDICHNDLKMQCNPLL